MIQRDLKSEIMEQGPVEWERERSKGELVSIGEDARSDFFTARPASET